MARVPTIDPAEFPPELADAVGHPGSDQRVALGALPAWAVRPDLAVAMVTFHNRCRSCMAVRSGEAIADGMSDGAVCSLERPDEADDLADGEKAALHYADLMATDHLAVDEAVFDRLRRHFDDEEIVELGAHIGTCVGFGRLSATWDLVDDLPTSFRSDDAAPWSEGATIR